MFRASFILVRSGVGYLLALIGVVGGLSVALQIRSRVIHRRLHLGCCFVVEPVGRMVLLMGVAAEEIAKGGPTSV